MKTKVLRLSLITVLMLVVALFMLTGCDLLPSDVEGEVVDVEIVSLPEDGVFIGRFNEGDIQVKLTFEDGSTRIVRLLESDIPEEYAHFLETPGEHYFEMLYRGKEISFTLLVKQAVCKVTFVNAIDEVVRTIDYDVIKGTPSIVAPPDEEMFVAGYRFTGEFDRSFEGITGDTVIKGVYVKTHLVTFYNALDEVAWEEEVDFGGTAIGPDAEDMYVPGYVFMGTFDRSLENITNDTDIRGVYAEMKTVRFYNYFGELISEQKVVVGGTATAPEAEDMNVEGYRFTGAFDRSLENITEDTDIWGVYIKLNLVTFYNCFGEIVWEEEVELGGTAIGPEASEMNVPGYRFTGAFDKSLENITEETDIWGVYVKVCTVRFYNCVGTLISEQEIDLGGNAVAPTEEEMFVPGYRFTGSFDKDLENVTEDMSVAGAYIKTFVVKFYNGMNEVIAEQIVDEGADAIEPSEEQRVVSGYIFKSWDRGFTNVQKDLNVYGVYVKGYVIEYSAEDPSRGSVFGSVASGSCIAAGTSVTLSATPSVGKDFLGWYVNGELVSSDAEYTFVMPTKNVTVVAKFGSVCDIEGHDNVTYEAQEPTCLLTGWREYTICRRCGDSTYVQIAALGHDDHWIAETEATCTADGLEVLKCTRCGLITETRIVDELGHEMVGNECSRCHGHRYVITIEYKHTDGSTAADRVELVIWEGESFTVTSPAIEGFRADLAYISGEANSDKGYVVTYSAIELERITRLKSVSLGNIEYNTAFAELRLPSTIIAITSTGRELILPVYWDATTYSKTTYGEQRIVGAVSAGYGYVLDCENVVRATLTVSENIIVSVNEMNLGRLPLGTRYEGLGLPTTAGVTTSSGAVYYMPVTWNTYSYDSSIEGNHSITGYITLTEGFVFDSGVTNVATVTFQLSEAMYGTADIVFIVDTTGSMGDEIANVRRNINAFAARLEREGVSVRWALLEYRDITCDGLDSTKIIYCGSSEWFIDVISYEKAIESLRVTGGGDRPETIIDALKAATLLENREDAKTFYIVVTDADYKTNNRYGITDMNEMIAELNAKDITTSVVTKTSYYNVYRALTDATDGILANIDGNFAEELWKLCDLIVEDVVYGAVEKIEIIKAPDKTVYEQGDYFNGSGMIVQATYTSGRTKIVSVYSVMPCGALQLTDTQIEINYRGKVAYLPITVNLTIIPATGIEVSQSNVALEVGSSFTVIANVVPSNATNANVVWSTNNPNVATVVNGRITGIGVGSTTVVVETLDGLFRTEITVTVTAKYVPVEAVITSIGAIQLPPDATYTVVATVFPVDATNKSLIWTSSNPEVATVVDGVITAISEGTATITVTTAAEGLTARIYVVVKSDTSNVGGMVFTASGSSLSGVTVEAYRYGIKVAETVTDYNGAYSFGALVYGDYVFKFSKDTYISSEYSFTVDAERHTIENIYLAVNNDYLGTAYGYVRDATNNIGISGITVNVRAGTNNRNGEIIATFTTGSGGYYYTTELTNGYYTFEFVDNRGVAESSAYTTAFVNVTIVGNSSVSCDVSMSGGLTPDIENMRIVLTWGSSPDDLDSHLVIDSYDTEYHIYYGNKTQVGANADLDVDDTTSYGPETVTIRSFNEDAVYYYYVYKFSSNGNDLPYSGAQVAVYFGDSLYQTFTVPSGSGRYWNVFSYNAYTGVFTVINSVSTDSVA